jgi:hypothetical protein
LEENFVEKEHMNSRDQRLSSGVDSKFDGNYRFSGGEDRGKNCAEILGENPV